MSYISHEDFKNLMSKFQAETPKGMLKEVVEEKKKLTPKQKEFAALAPPKDKITYADRMAGIKKGMKKEYGYADKYPGSWEEGKQRHSVTGRGMRESHEGMDKWYDDFGAEVERLISQQYVKDTDRKAVREKVKKALDLVNITDKYADRKADDAAKDFVRNLDFILAHPNKNEGLHTPPLQATGQTISTTEADTMASSLVTNPEAQTELKGPELSLEKLTSDERKQLGEFVEAINTTKKAIEELLEKASGKRVKVKETMGGNHSSGLVMKPTTVSENAEDTEKRVSSEPHVIFKKLIKALKDEGLDDIDIQMFIKHEMEEIGKEAVMGQHDPY